MSRMKRLDDDRELHRELSTTLRRAAAAPAQGAVRRRGIEDRVDEGARLETGGAVGFLTHGLGSMVDNAWQSPSPTKSS